MMRLARRKLLVAVAAALILASAVGAVKMLRLRSYGWSNASGVLALLPIPSGLFWPIGLLIGIWRWWSLAATTSRPPSASGGIPSACPMFTIRTAPTLKPLLARAIFQVAPRPHDLATSVILARQHLQRTPGGNRPGPPE